MAQMKYSDMIKRLEEIISKLESGDASLEDSLKLFEEGTTLVSKCNEILTESRLKITQLTQLTDGDDNE